MNIVLLGLMLLAVEPGYTSEMREHKVVLPNPEIPKFIANLRHDLHDTYEGDYYVLLPQTSDFFTPEARSTGREQIFAIFDVLASTIPLENYIFIEFRSCMTGPWFSWIWNRSSYALKFCMPYKALSTEYVTLTPDMLSEVRAAIHNTVNRTQRYEPRGIERK